MRLDHFMLEIGMAASRSEAQRLIKAGAVETGLCKPDCPLRVRPPFQCTCGGWETVRDVSYILPDVPKICVRIGTKDWRIVKGSDGRFEQRFANGSYGTVHIRLNAV